MVFQSFLKNKAGNYALATIGAMVPLMGALAVGVDYTEMSRQRASTINATDAAAVATARRLIEGASEAELNAYARTFFDANLSGVDSELTKLTLILPKNNAGGGTLKLTADLKYQPVFLGAFEALSGRQLSKPDFTVSTEVQLKNTMEIALVLDNSGSMEYVGTGSNKKRMELLKTAAKELVDSLSAQSKMMQQLTKPVQIGVVPFSATVNVGADKRYASWMDTEGVSPIHHEVFYWPDIGARTGQMARVEYASNGAWYARGSWWGSYWENKPMSRFAVYEWLSKMQNGTRVFNAFPWSGCVEARPWPYHVNDTAPSQGKPETLFVPTFAMDDIGNKVTKTEGANKNYYAANNWLDDYPTEETNLVLRQLSPLKYFAEPHANAPQPTWMTGPNSSCTTYPLLPLTDVTTTAGVNTVKSNIDAMFSSGLTNVTEGMAWGWRVLSSREPFTNGRSETEKGNDKVLIVLTDGINTYFTPQSSGFQDPSSNKSIYGAYGHVENPYRPNNGRIFAGTTVSKTTYNELNYSTAMNQHFSQLCDNAKTDKLMVITVALDLNSSDAYERTMIDLLRNCSSESRIRKGEKLFWNATGQSLQGVFKEIGDELSNLRITS